LNLKTSFEVLKIGFEALEMGFKALNMGFEELEMGFEVSHNWSDPLREKCIFCYWRSKENPTPTKP
jgi:hypothetical protein